MNRMDGYNNGDGIEDSPGLDKRKVRDISALAEAKYKFILGYFQH